MSTPKHPSADLLSGFFDDQLTSDERNQVETHLTGCTDCAATVNDFSRLEDLGPLIEEALPTSAYFEDLPDRVLARIAMEEQQEAIAATVAGNEAGSPWYRRLLNPVGAWRWATATAVVGLLVVGGVMRAQGPGTDVAQAPEASGADAAGSSAEEVPGIEVATNRAAPPSRDSEGAFNRRVFDTLGETDGNYGTLIDVIPADEPSGARGPSTGANSPIQRVSGTGSVESGGLSDPRDQYYLDSIYENARRAELVGNLAAATRGFEQVRNGTIPGNALRRAADLGLLRLEWRRQIQQAGPESLTALRSLFDEANRMYGLHVRGDHRGCARAWELHAAYLDVAQGHTTPDVLNDVRLRMQDLQRCFEGGVVR